MSIKGWIKKEVLRLDRQVDRWQIDRGADRCNGKKNLCIYTYIYIYDGILFSHKKEGNPAICNNMDGTWGSYARWNKSKTNAI